MKSKLIAIWRIIRAYEYVVVCDNGMSASYRSENKGVAIKAVVELLKRMQQIKEGDEK